MSARIRKAFSFAHVFRDTNVFYLRSVSAISPDNSGHTATHHVAADVAFVHLPELLSILQSDSLRSVQRSRSRRMNAYSRGFIRFLERQVHEIIAGDKVSVESLAILELDQL